MHANRGESPPCGNTLSAMWPRLADEALVLGDEVNTFADLLLVGISTDLIEQATDMTRRGLWALEQAGFDLPREKVVEAAITFRRARKLESGQDLRSWLAARQLTMDEWEAHLRRSLAGRLLPSSDVPTGAPEVGLDSEVLVTDLTCGGWWQRFADLATRLWAASRLVEGDLHVADSDIGDEMGRILAAVMQLVDVDEQWCAERVRRVRIRERALEEAARDYARVDWVAARILEHGADWTELRFDELVLPTCEAANEAVLCAREDGVSAADLAERCALPLRHRSSRHDLLPAAVASLLDGALHDQAFGPVALDNRWAVLWLRERRRPSLEDDAVRATAAAELLDEAIARVSQGLIRESSAL